VHPPLAVDESEVYSARPSLAADGSEVYSARPFLAADGSEVYSALPSLAADGSEVHGFTGFHHLIIVRNFSSRSDGGATHAFSLYSV
jgi:hypothetical protein